MHFLPPDETSDPQQETNHLSRLHLVSYSPTETLRGSAGFWVPGEETKRHEDNMKKTKTRRQHEEDKDEATSLQTSQHTSDKNIKTQLKYKRG